MYVCMYIYIYIYIYIYKVSARASLWVYSRAFWAGPSVDRGFPRRACAPTWYCAYLIPVLLLESCVPT